MTSIRALAAADDTRPLLCALLRDLHRLGWATGTGGGICGPAPGDALWVAPTGVHKELVEPQDFFAIRIEDGDVAHAPDGLEPSECTPIFLAIARRRGARSVMHSHALSAVLVGDLADGDVLRIEGFEMLKGLGIANTESLGVPVIRNTEREHDLSGSVEQVLDDPRFARASAVLVKDHGCYLWGDDVMQTKQRAEVHHWLFDAAIARRNTGRR